MHMPRSIAPISLGLCLLASAVAEARPLDPEACGKLRGELVILDEKGVKALIDKGPMAVKDTATKEQLRQVRQYFDLLGTFRFRCPQDQPIVVLRPEPVEDPSVIAAAGAPIDAGSPGITLPAGVAAATVGPIVPSAPRKPAAPKQAIVKTAPTPAPPPGAPPPGAPPPGAPLPATRLPAAAAPGEVAPVAKKPAAAPKVARPVTPAIPTPGLPAAGAPVAPAAPKPKPTPKAKADDAFRPAIGATPATAPAATAPAPPQPKTP